VRHWNNLSPSAPRGPVVIVGRPHSGTRMVARFLLDHGVFLGADVVDGFLDSLGWYQGFVVPLVTSRFFPAGLSDMADADLAHLCEQLLQDTWRRYWVNAWQRSAWGWKYPETLFVMPLVKALFPSARFLHVVRDVRDVCLSENGFFQLTGRHADPLGWRPARVGRSLPTYQDFCTAVTFGCPGVAEWNGINLRDRCALTRNRFLIQAQAWITCVGHARAHGQRLGNDYLELRYEDVCGDPGAAADRVLAFAGIDRSEATDAAVRRIRTDRLRRWRDARLTLMEQRDLANAADLAATLMRESGYPA
jgi:Sulfotransferase family